jgi:oxygen-independent coproporphyrinogen-3 oxidase
MSKRIHSYAELDRQTLQRYDQPGPRYTSYPTAPVWTDSFGPEDWGAALERANADKDAPLSVYVHLPFCHSLCLYCGCSVHITHKMDLARSYVDLLLVEADMLAAKLPDRRAVWAAPLGWRHADLSSARRDRAALPRDRGALSLTR